MNADYEFQEQDCQSWAYWASFIFSEQRMEERAAAQMARQGAHGNPNTLQKRLASGKRGRARAREAKLQERAADG